MPDPHSPDEVSVEIQKRVLREFIASAPAGFLMLDHELRHVEVSPRWTADWGENRSDLLGVHHYEIHPDLPDHIRQAHRRALAGEVVFNPGDRFLLDGNEVCAAWEVRPWGDPKHEAGGIIIYAEDLTKKGRTSRLEAGQASEPTEPHAALSSSSMVSRALSWASYGRVALQTLLSGYREVACNCSAGYYERHRAHHRNCLAHATVPLIVRAEKAVRQLYMLEDFLGKDLTPKN